MERAALTDSRPPNPWRRRRSTGRSAARKRAYLGQNSIIRKEGKGFDLARRPQARYEGDGGRGHPQTSLRVEYYDVDEQEVAAAADTFPKATVADILNRLSYSSSFLGPANQAAAKEKGESSVLGPGSV
jgi:hypothetical protein